VVEAPPARRGELIGAALGAAIFGALFGPVLGTIASSVGTGPPFAAVAALAIVLVAWTLATKVHRPPEPQPLRLLFAALRDRGVLAGAWLVLLPALGFGVLTVLAPLHLAALGFGAAAVGATFLVSAGFEALLSPVVGRISDRRGRLVPLRSGLAGGVVVTAVLAFAGERWLLAACVLGAAVSFGSFWAPSMSLLADRAEALGLGHGYGFALVNLAWAPGAAIGGAAGGAIARATGDAVPFLALTVLFAVTLLLVLRSIGAAAPELAKR
jgi:predicted MFS family arabinose efflux permease